MSESRLLRLLITANLELELNISATQDPAGGRRYVLDLRIDVTASRNRYYP
jgi:hypothetical protein